MIKGLDEAAKRAEKIEAREEEKRRSGGKMNANVALHADETGTRWKRMVNVVLIVAALAIIGTGGTLFYLANHKKVNPREINAEARQMLSQLVGIANRIKPFEASETITADAAKRKMLDVMDADIKNYDEQIQKDKERIEKTKSKETQRSMIRKDREAIARLRELKDGLGQPFIFEMAGADTLKMSAKGSNGDGATPPEPVTVKLRKLEK
jgi:hypothetical protein